MRISQLATSHAKTYKFFFKFLIPLGNHQQPWVGNVKGKMDDVGVLDL